MGGAKSLACEVAGGSEQAVKRRRDVVNVGGGSSSSSNRGPRGDCLEPPNVGQTGAFLCISGPVPWVEPSDVCSKM